MTRHNAPQTTGCDEMANRVNSTVAAEMKNNAPDAKNSVTKCYTVLDVPIYSVAWWALHGVIARQGRAE